MKKGFWQSLGPSIITAAVVIGPGTITTASKLGAAEGMSMLWVVLVAASFMMLFTSMAARIGVMNEDSPLTVVSKVYGRWLAVLMGLLSFIVAASFQASNYIACGAALDSLTDGKELLGLPAQQFWMVVVALGALTFVFAAKQLYKFLERVMMALVGLMVLAFAINLVLSKPDMGQFVEGLWPSAWKPANQGLIIAMTATTFSVIAALYQATLAHQKGWRKDNLTTATCESMVGITVLGAISMMVMMTSAATLRGSEITNAGDLAAQLEPALGSFAVVLFGMGFLAAGFSSTVINAMIGGGLLADGVGLKADMNALPNRVFTTVAMLVGFYAAWVQLRSNSPLDGIVQAQQLTIVAVPLVAFMLLNMASDSRVVGKRQSNILVRFWGTIAFIVLCVFTINKLLPLVAKLLPYFFPQS